MITTIRVLSNDDRRTIIIDDEVEDLSPLARTFLAVVRKIAAQKPVGIATAQAGGHFS